MKIFGYILAYSVDFLGNLYYNEQLFIVSKKVFNEVLH
jgi:hypothetical protein